MLEIEICVIGAKRRLCETIEYWSFRKFEIKKESNLNVFSEVKASLIAQLVKNPPAMEETLVQFQGWEDPLEKG